MEQNSMCSRNTCVFTSKVPTVCFTWILGNNTFWWLSWILRTERKYKLKKREKVKGKGALRRTENEFGTELNGTLEATIYPRDMPAHSEGKRLWETSHMGYHVTIHTWRQNEDHFQHAIFAMHIFFWKYYSKYKCDPKKGRTWDTRNTKTETSKASK